MRQKKRWMAIGLAAMMTTTAAPMPAMAEAELLSSGSEATVETAAETADESTAAELLEDGQAETGSDSADSGASDLLLETPGAESADAVLEPDSEQVSDELASAEALETSEVGENGDETQAATSGKCGENVTWEMSEEGVLTIKGSGPMYERNYSAEKEGESSILFGYRNEEGKLTSYSERGWNWEQVKEVRVESGVTNVGTDMFYECDNLTKVSLADTVLEIGDYAFGDCDNLSEVSLPDGITTIGERAFNYGAFKTIQLPSALTKMGKSAFYACDNLEEIEIPEGVTKIPEYAFSECDALHIVKLPDTVVEIEQYAFDDCDKLSEIHLPENLTTIGESAFAYSALKEIQLPVGLKNIEESLFQSCKKLEEIVIPEGITKIGRGAFNACSALHTVKLPDTLKQIGVSAFSGCSSLKSMEIPDSVIEIGQDAFSYCESLEAVHLPKNLLAINEETFVRTALREVEIPDSVLFIEASVFEESPNLEKVTFGTGLLKIHETVFYNCENLKTLVFKGNAPKISEYAFDRESREAISAVYPRDNESWTPQVMRNYGAAKINWEMAPLTELAAPTVKLSNTNEGIRVNWEAVKYAESYEIFRKMENGEFVKVAAVGADTLTYSDKDVLNGKAYTYAVTAHSGEIASEAGQQKLMFLNNPGTNLANTSKGVKVSWNRVPSAKGYEVYRRLSTDKTYTKIATIKKGTTTSYVDAGTKSGKVYVYAVKAFYNSKHKSAHTRQSIRSLQTPTITKAVRGKTGVSLRWTAVSGAKGYYVYRKAGNGKYVRIVTRDKVGAVTFKDTKAKAGQTYTYAVRAFNGKSMSAFIGKTVK